MYHLCSDASCAVMQARHQRVVGFCRARPAGSVGPGGHSRFICHVWLEVVTCWDGLVMPLVHCRAARQRCHSMPVCRPLHVVVNSRLQGRLFTHSLHDVCIAHAVAGPGGWLSSPVSGNVLCVGFCTAAAQHCRDDALQEWCILGANCPVATSSSVALLLSCLLHQHMAVLPPRTPPCAVSSLRAPSANPRAIKKPRSSYRWLTRMSDGCRHPAWNCQRLMRWMCQLRCLDCAVFWCVCFRAMHQLACTLHPDEADRSAAVLFHHVVHIMRCNWRDTGNMAEGHLHT